MYVESDTRSGLGPYAPKWRLNRLSGRGALMSVMFVRRVSLRMTSRGPRCFMRRSTVQRAAEKLLRFIWRQIVGTVDFGVRRDIGVYGFSLESRSV